MSKNIDVSSMFTMFTEKKLNNFVSYIVMQEASDALSKTADNVSTYQVSSVQLMTDKKLEAFDKV